MRSLNDTPPQWMLGDADVRRLLGRTALFDLENLASAIVAAIEADMM